MLTMLALGAAAGWGWQAMAKPEPEQRQFALSLAPLPTVLSPDQLRSFSQHAPPADGGIKQTRQQLSDLAQLKPNWAIDYSEQLVQQAQVLWPEQAKTLSLAVAAADHSRRAAGGKISPGGIRECSNCSN